MKAAKEKRISTGTPGGISKKIFCLYCKLLYERHLVTGVGKNLSMRDGERFLLTPSGYSLRNMDHWTR